LSNTQIDQMETGLFSQLHRETASRIQRNQRLMAGFASAGVLVVGAALIAPMLQDSNNGILSAARDISVTEQRFVNTDGSYDFGSLGGAEPPLATNEGVKDSVVKTGN